MEGGQLVLQALQPAGNSAMLSTGLVLVCLYLYWRLSSNRSFRKMVERIPGPPGYPIIGNLLDLAGTHNMAFNTIANHCEKYPDVVKISAGPIHFIFLTNPADVEIILNSHIHLEKSVVYDFLKPWLGNGLLVSSGETWRTHRKIIAPTFHLNVLRGFMSRFNENAKLTVSRMAEEKEQEFDVHDYMSECTVETLIETVMGVKKEGRGRQCFEYAMAVMKLCDIIHLRTRKPYLWPDFLFHSTKLGFSQKSLLGIIHGLTEKILKAKKSQIESKTKTEEDTIEVAKEVEPTSNTGTNTTHGFSFGQASGLKDDLDVDDVGEKKRSGFLETLIEKAGNNEGINDKEVKEQLDTIMFEGHDTTAAASSFFLCMMAAHPEVQAKCYEELEKIYGDSNRPVTFQDTQEMKYLERCLMETLRLYPPVPIIARKLRTNVKLASSDLTIPADCTVVIGTYRLHRRPDTYPDPDRFDPDNFLPEKSASRHFYSFIPFSAGPRSCVGRKYAMLKLKTILATVLRSYQVLPGPKEADWKLQADIILKRTDGFRIRLQPRKLHTQ